MFRFVSTALAICLIAGCSQSTAPQLIAVSGVVSLDGKPLPNATVMFQPESGRPSLATTDHSGRYQLLYTRSVPGAIPGKHIVNIRTRAEDESGREVTKEFLPPRYHDQTELTADVSKENKVINFDLTSGR